MKDDSTRGGGSAKYSDQGEAAGLMKPQGELYGDDAPMTDKGGSRKGNFAGSMGDRSQGDLKQGFGNGGKMKGTKSDKGFA